MIKAIIVDIDGVIVGDKTGVNFPLPNSLVIDKIIELHKKSIKIIFCTGKYKSGILELVQKTGLDNPHITDGGALIINPLKNQIINSNIIAKELTSFMVDFFIKNNIYTELYGMDEYFIQRSQVYEDTDKHTAILQQEPIIVDSLVDQVSKIDSIKIIICSRNNKEKDLINEFSQAVKNQVNAVWTVHPTLLPTELCIFTSKGVSKKTAAQEVLSHLNISFNETLGIGDTLGDWNFMNLCKYAATVGEVNQEFKEKVTSKGEGNYFLGPSIDKNGILDVFDYFIK